MSQTSTVTAKCYIEVGDGHLGARLRKKHTGRRVSTGTMTTEGEKQHFLRFLSAAAATRVQLPDLFSKDGDRDCIIVSGNLDFDAPDEIRFIHNENLSYLFD